MKFIKLGQQAILSITVAAFGAAAVPVATYAATSTSKSFAAVVTADTCVGTALPGCTITVLDDGISKTVKLVPGGNYFGFSSYYGFKPTDNIVGKKVAVYAYQTGPTTYDLSQIGNFVRVYP